MNKSILLYISVVLLLTACNVTKKVKSGVVAYDVKHYALAADLYEQEFKSTDDKASKALKAYKLGKCYDALNDASNASKWYYTADDLDYGIDATVGLAFALKGTERYEEAISVFQRLVKNNTASPYKREIPICQQAMKWKKKFKDNYSITSVNSNSEFADYAPVYYEDNFVVFSSDRLISTGNYIYEWTGNDYSDLYIMSKKGNNIYSFDATFNTEENEGAACFNSTSTEIFFTRCSALSDDDIHCRIYYSNRDEGYWTEPRPLLFFEETVNVGHPCLIENDSVLVFSVETDKAKGYHDLFYAVRDQGGWSQPEAMPDYINTEGDEVFPTSYNDTLYFSSNHHAGMGGLDIFKTYLNENNSWSKPLNLKYPINSGGDDFSYSVDKGFEPKATILSRGFFSSNREGDDNIYMFSQKKKELTDEEIFAEENTLPEKEASPLEVYLAVSVFKKERVDDDPNMALLEPKPAPDANLIILENGVALESRMGKNGKTIVQIDLNKSYEIKGSAKDYLSDSKIFDTNSISNPKGKSSVTINKELYLEKIYYNKEITLENIYYDFDKADIRSDAQPTLNELSELLMANPQISIELGSHTDCQGEIDYNRNLSQKRAESAVEYIKSKGINRSRLMAKGYGEGSPNVVCECDDCTEEQHQQNRRTTFRIVASN